jgi:hypothetical protein
MSINNFTFHYVIGRGGFGKVIFHRSIPLLSPLGLESRKEKDKDHLCYEGNVQSQVKMPFLAPILTFFQSHFEEKCCFRYE